MSFEGTNKQIKGQKALILMSQIGCYSWQIPQNGLKTAILATFFTKYIFL
jgi:FMN-dependent NADH-azoreductase